MYSAPPYQCLPSIWWHPPLQMKYAAMLGDKLERHGTAVWLVNTGWTGGRCAAHSSTLTRDRMRHATDWAIAGLRAIWYRVAVPAALFTRCRSGPHALLPRFGEGSRIPLEYTRAVMQAIHSGERTSCCQHTKHQLGERIGGALSQLRRDEWLCLLRSAVPRTRTPHLQ